MSLVRGGGWHVGQVLVRSMASSAARAAAEQQPGPVMAAIRQKLTERFQPTTLDVKNESYMHSVPRGSETHFKVTIVSDQFEGMKLIE
ncbi:uncharacterized protein MONBRDRAFT_38125, partial [Monosiga brevicollis MX1]